MISCVVTQIINVAFLRMIIAKFSKSVVLYLSLFGKMACTYFYENVQG